MVDESTLEKIEAYLNNSMMDSERLQFEKELSEKPVLREALEAFRSVQDIILAGGRQEIQNRVDTAFERSLETTPSPSAKTFTLRRILSAAAVLLILVTALFVFDIFKTNASPEELYAAYFEIPSPPTLRSNSSKLVTGWEDAVNAYKMQDYSKTIELLKPVLLNPQFQRKDEAFLLLGTAHLQLNQSDEALRNFKQVDALSSFKSQADWLSALTYLKSGDLKNAKVILNKIVLEENYKSVEAQKILEELE